MQGERMMGNKELINDGINLGFDNFFSYWV